MSVHTSSSILVCPETKLPLRECALEEAERLLSGGAPLVSRASTERSTSFGRTPRVMLCEAGGWAYPVVKDIPVLLVPEMLLPSNRRRDFDLTDPRYAEAYEEMDHYNKVAEAEIGDVAQSEGVRLLQPMLNATKSQLDSYPEPPLVWLDAAYDSAAQLTGLRYLGKVRGKRVLQLGGTGLHSVKFLLAGAEEAWLLTPMHGEAQLGLAMARHCGVESRMRCAVGIAEELPFAEATFDVILSPGSLHHMTTELALPESARILRPGGKFAAFDPWRTPVYQIGITVFGKREPGVFCRPITRERARPLFSTFGEARLVHHGALSRYALLVLCKLGLKLPLSFNHRIMTADDVLSSAIPLLRRVMGSSVAVLGSRVESLDGCDSSRRRRGTV